MSVKIVVAGSSNTDMIIKVPHIPKPGETILGGTFTTAAGGKGANQAVGAARAGGDVSFVARVGDDMFGEEAARVLLEKGVETVVVTLGRKGALLVSSKGVEHIPGFKVDAVDATAAGDVFNGTLAVALAEKKSFQDAILFANAAAALSVTKLGAQPSAPHREDIEKMQQSTKSM